MNSWDSSDTVHSLCQGPGGATGPKGDQVSQLRWSGQICSPRVLQLLWLGAAWLG